MSLHCPHIPCTKRKHTTLFLGSPSIGIISGAILDEHWELNGIAGFLTSSQTMEFAVKKVRVLSARSFACTESIGSDQYRPSHATRKNTACVVVRGVELVNTCITFIPQIMLQP